MRICVYDSEREEFERKIKERQADRQINKRTYIQTDKRQTERRVAFNSRKRSRVPFCCCFVGRGVLLLLFWVVVGFFCWVCVFFCVFFFLFFCCFFLLFFCISFSFSVSRAIHPSAVFPLFINYTWVDDFHFSVFSNAKDRFYMQNE